jgi:DNA topoisomerase-1
VDDAVKLLAEPKRFGRRRAAPAPPLRELGVDPVSEKPVVVKDGRFGPYVTDGETNASLRKGDTVENVTIERAAELLQIRREAGPAKKARKATKKAAKKTAKKSTKAGAKRKAPAKNAAKKATTQAMTKATTNDEAPSDE